MRQVVQHNLDFVLIEENEFWLDVNEKKDIELRFDVKDKLPGIYFGLIKFVGELDLKLLPIILEIESKEVLFDSILSIPVEYSNVYVEGDLVVETKLFNLENIGAKNVDVEWFIKDFNGKVIFSDEDNLVVESSVSNTKVLKISEDVEKGNYIFGIIINYGDSVGVSSHYFEVIEKKKGLSESYFVWIVFTLLLLIILFILYNSFRKDKYLAELHKQYRSEVRKEVAKVVCEKRRVNALKPSEKVKKLKKISRNYKKKLKKVKAVHKVRVKEIKRLKKKKKISEVKKKLNEWKKQGYNVDEFLIARGKNKKENLGEKVNKLKKQGYGV